MKSHTLLCKTKEEGGRNNRALNCDTFSNKNTDISVFQDKMFQCKNKINEIHPDIDCRWIPQTLKFELNNFLNNNNTIFSVE